jgi:hypothetical protein
LVHTKRNGSNGWLFDFDSHCSDWAKEVSGQFANHDRAAGGYLVQSFRGEEIENWL